MHIVQLALDNFMAFPRRTVIAFHDGFTVISGMNGAGKSSIIDAVGFVLSPASAEKSGRFINTASGKDYAEVMLKFSDGTCIRRRIKTRTKRANNISRPAIHPTPRGCGFSRVSNYKEHGPDRARHRKKLPNHLSRPRIPENRNDAEGDYEEGT